MVDIFGGSSVNYNNDSMTARRVETTGKRNNTQLTVKVQKSPPVLVLSSFLYLFYSYFLSKPTPLLKVVLFYLSIFFISFSFSFLFFSFFYFLFSFSFFLFSFSFSFSFRFFFFFLSFPCCIFTSLVLLMVFFFRYLARFTA